jgi:hypothetical protein
MLRVTAAVVLALAGLPAVSHAATATVDPDERWVVFHAAPGEVNRLLIEISTTGRVVRLSDAGAAIAAGPGCQADSAGRVLCQIEDGVRLVQADLADGADRADVVTASLRAAQVNVTGGAGDDVIRGRGPSRLNFSGNEGNDLLHGSEGEDVLRGQDGDDRMSGRDGGDLMIGDAGDDVLRAGAGRDRLFGGLGTDKLDARDRPALADSVVHCGPGRDLTTLDRPDRPRMRQCEIVR